MQFVGAGEAQSQATPEEQQPFTTDSPVTARTSSAPTTSGHWTPESRDKQFPQSALPPTRAPMTRLPTRWGQISAHNDLKTPRTTIPSTAPTASRLSRRIRQDDWHFALRAATRSLPLSLTVSVGEERRRRKSACWVMARSLSRAPRQRRARVRPVHAPVPLHSLRCWSVTPERAVRETG